VIWIRRGEWQEPFFRPVSGPAQELQATYGTVDNIDPFEGMLAEDHLPGADVGPTINPLALTLTVQ